MFRGNQNIMERLQMKFQHIIQKDTANYVQENCGTKQGRTLTRIVSTVYRTSVSRL